MSTARLLRAFAVATAVGVVVAGCSSPPDAADSSTPSPEATALDPLAASDAALADAIRDPKGPGCAAAVARNGEVLWSGGRGLADVELGTPITDQTRFDLGSVSKHITALTVLTLVDEGAVDLDATVDHYVPELGAWTSDTTVRDLMLHTSGLPDYTALLIEQGQPLTDSATQADALAALGDATAGRAQPFEYSNSNYVTLAHIVEQVTGEPFAQVVGDRLFGPVGSTLTVDPAAAAPHIAARYADVATLTPLTNEWRQVGDGAVVGSVIELALWLDVYRTGLPGSPTAIESATSMDGAFIGPDGSAYHAGIIVGPDGALSHAGGWQGHVALAGVSSGRDLTIALACNAPDAGSDTLASALLAIWVTP